MSVASRGDARTDRRATGQRRWLTDGLVCVVLALLSLGFTSFHVHGHKAISAFDEYMYIDYYAKVADHGIVRQGELVGDFARRYHSCHENRQFGPVEPQRCPASSPRPDDVYPFQSRTWADWYSPLYFASVRVLAQPLVWSGVDFVQAGRYASGAWLAFAVVLLYLTLRRLKLPRSIAFAGGLAMSASMPGYWSNTYLSTDATALASGAGLLYLGIGLAERPSRLRAALLVGVTGLAVAFKLQNLSGAAVAGLFVMLMTLNQARTAQGSLRSALGPFLRDLRTRAVLGALAFAVVVQVAWLAIRASFAVDTTLIDQGVDGPFLFPSHLLLDMGSQLPLSLMFYDDYAGSYAIVAARLMVLVVAGGVIGLAFGRVVPAVDRSLAWAVVTASILGPVALTLATMVMTGTYVPLVPRYGYAVVPGMIACASLLVPAESRVARVGALALAAALFVLGFWFTNA